MGGLDNATISIYGKSKKLRDVPDLLSWGSKSSRPSGGEIILTTCSPDQ